MSHVGRGRAHGECESPVGPGPRREVTAAGVGVEGTPVVGYLRVSTDRQVVDGAGLEVQRDAVASWAAGRGCELVDVFADEGLSGSNGLEVRVGLAEALEAVREGRAAGVVVYRLDRLARDLMVQEQLLAEVWRAGAEVWSCSPAEAQYLVRDDPGDPSRKLIRQVLGAVAEYERAMIRLRLAAGRARKHAAGGYAYGAPPFGFEARDGALVAVPAEQLVIARVRELAGLGLSNNRIADQLNVEGFATRAGKSWHREQVRRILNR